MSTVSQPTRLVIAEHFLRGIGRPDPDLDGLGGLLTEDVVYRALARNSLTGTFSGRDAVIAHLREVAEVTQGTYDAIKWEDWLIGEFHVAALVDVHMQVDHRLYRGRHLVLVSFDLHDKIEAITVFFEDPDALDRVIDR